jgi:hypothetical protein
MPKTSKIDALDIDIKAIAKAITAGNNGIVEDGGAIAKGTDADFWSLLAICALEDGDPQGRADVAQSIYNRVGSKAYPDQSIKGIITRPGQYEPTFARGTKITAKPWKDIKDLNTAIAAIKYTKGWSDSLIKQNLKDTFNALTNQSLQIKARNFVQGRTDFLGASTEPPRKRNAEVPSRRAIQRNKRDNIFAWNNNYKKNKVYDVPFIILFPDTYKSYFLY